MFQRRLAVVLLLFVCSLLAAGCRKKAASSAAVPPPPQAPAPTATIAADPNAIETGGTVQLSWSTENATEVSIDGLGTVESAGTQSVTPSESTTYKLVAKGPGGQTEASTRVTVTAPAAAAPTSPEIDDEAFQRAVLPIYFDYDSYLVRKDQAEKVQANARFLQEHVGLRLVIQGHADERGSTDYNLALGDNRANAIKQALAAAGVSESRISVISYGKEHPFCSESNESCWQENRRSHFAMQR
jgi:peptidoglycan-associated lipoprotein